MAGGGLSETEPGPARSSLRETDHKEVAMKRNALLAILLGATVMLNACATVKGFGRDVQSVGEAGSEAID